jgi:hypothetical protein
VPALIQLVARGGGHPARAGDRYLGHVDVSMDARCTHQLDHQYLDDAKTLSDYLNVPTRSAA